MLEFYHIKYPKARKEHVCDLCGSKIRLGQTYERYSGKYDGNMFDLKYCLNCEKMQVTKQVQKETQYEQ